MTIPGFLAAILVGVWTATQVYLIGAWVRLDWEWFLAEGADGDREVALLGYMLLAFVNFFLGMLISIEGPGKPSAPPPPAPPPIPRSER